MNEQSSQEFSLCGMLETPGYTGHQGFGRRLQRTGTGARDSNCGNMFADLSSFGPDLSQHHHNSRCV